MAGGGSGEGKSSLWRPLARIGTVASALSIFSAVFIFWDTVCERFPAVAGMVPFAECKASPAKAFKAPERALAASEDPLEILTRRGYRQLDHHAYFHAFKLGRMEDVELLVKAGIKMSAVVIEDWHIPKKKWDQFISANAVLHSPFCDWKVPSPSSWDRPVWWSRPSILLEGAIKNNNIEIFKSLCGGQYVKKILTALKNKDEDLISINTPEYRKEFTQFIDDFKRVMSLP